MSENTKIEWATHTFNPWRGCRRVSPGCQNCYMFALLKRFGLDPTKRYPASEATWRNPVKWNRGPFACDNCGKQFVQLTGRQKLCEPVPGDSCHYCNFGRYARPRVFPSLCDCWDDEVPIKWLADFLKLIHDTPNLDWLLLTKRPENWRGRLQSILDSHNSLHHPESFFVWVEHWLWKDGLHESPPNIWLGVSVEDRLRKDRIDVLRDIPAAVRFLSLEPLLEDLGELNLDGIHWVIVGGESGPKARPCNVEWVRSIVEQCWAAYVSCFVKQLGRFAAQDLSAVMPEADITDESADPSAIAAWEFNRYHAHLFLKHPKGGDPSEWPKDLRVRQFPSSV